MKKITFLILAFISLNSLLIAQSAKKLIKEGDRYLNLALSSKNSEKELSMDNAFDSYIQASNIDNNEKYKNDFRTNIWTLRGLYIDVAVEYYNNKVYDKSLQNMEKSLILGEFPKNSNDTLFDTGLITYYAAMIGRLGKNYPTAEKYCLICIEKGYQGSLPYFELSEVYKDTGKKTESLEILQKGLQKYPESKELSIGLINYYLLTGETQNALTYLNRAISQDPNNSTLYFAKGTLFDHMSNDVTFSYTQDKIKEYEELAITNYRKATEAKADYFDPYFNLGVIFYNKAVFILKDAEKISESKKYDIEVKKANDAFKYALPFLEKAYTINNSDNANIQALVVIYKKLGMTDQKNTAQKILDGDQNAKISITSLVNGNVIWKDFIFETDKVIITWENPQNPESETVQDNFNLKACIKSNSTIAKTELYQNNTQIENARAFKSSSNSCTLTLTQKITLIPGENYFRIYTVDANGKKTESEVRTIIYNQPSNLVNNNENNLIEKNEKRLALVIGNGAYKYGGNLGQQPINDATDIASSLKELGFEVIKVINGGQQQLDAEIEKFGKIANGYSTILFYYAGHGVQVNGENYIIPVDVSLSAESDVKYKCVPIGTVLGRMFGSGSNVNIVVLDACRDNPFERSWSRSSSGKGLSEIESPVGTIISYATSPGSTASNGNGRNGLYTSALLKFIKSPQLDIVDLFTKVRKEVYLQSEKKQITWESNSLMGEFYLKK